VRPGLLLAAAALAFGVALLIVRGVIPPVRDTWAPQAKDAGGAVPALWASVVAHLVFAGLLILAAIVDGLRRKPVRRVLAVLALGALLQALMYLDAAAAFHGPLEAPLQPAVTRLRYATAADAAAAVLVLVAVVTAARAGKARTGDAQPA
jgi:hypothetical protein